MQNLKKIFSILIILSLVLTAVPVSFAAENDVINYRNEINEFKKMGIVDYDLQSETLITRGEFAHLLVRFLGVSEESLNESVQLFYDVQIDHKDFQAVSYCARLGYMVGYGDNIFQPDKKLVAEEVFKPVILALGYGYKATIYGGNQAAYMQVANELGMLKGIDLPYGEYIFHEEAVKLLHNLLDTPVMVTTGISDGEISYSVDPEKTVLTEYHKMKRLTGILKATDVAGISGYTAQGDNECIVDGIKFNFTDTMVRTLLGYKVDVLYSIDEITKNTIITCQSADDMNKVTVHKESVGLFRSGSFVYFDENDKTNTLKVALDFEFFYNGKNHTFDETLIANSTYGYFELLSSKSNSTYDIVKFYDFKTLVVDRVSLDRELIQSASASDGMLNFDSYVYKSVFVDSNGEYFNIRDLKQNDVITYTLYENYIYAVVSQGSVSGIITELNKPEYEVFIDGVSYKLSGDKNVTLYPTLNVNQEVSGYIDCFGNITGVKLKNKNKLENIFLPIKMFKATEAGETTPGVKVYSFETNELKQIYFADNVKVNGSAGIDSLDNYSLLETTLFKDGTNHPCVLKINSKGLITVIETSKFVSDYLSTEDGLTTMLNNENLVHYNSTASFRSEAYTNPSTRAFMIPDDLSTAKADEFVELTSLPKDNLSRYVSVYTDSKENRYATIVLYKKSQYYKFPSKLVTGIITRITEAIDEDGDRYKKIYVTCDGVEDFFIVDNSELLDDFQPTSTQYYFRPAIKAGELNIGDYISYVKDDDGKLVLFNCFWKADKAGNIEDLYDSGKSQDKVTIDGVELDIDLGIGDGLKSTYQYFASSNRVTFSEVLALDSEFIKIKSNVIGAGKTTSFYDKIESIRYDGLQSVMVIEGCGTPNVKVYDASIEDIMLEDKIVFHSQSYILKRIFIIR